MMIKVALVLCAIVATSIVCANAGANDFEEQDAVDTLLNLMLSEAEEAASPDDAVALQGWKKRAAGHVARKIVRHPRHHSRHRHSWRFARTSRLVHRKIRRVQKLCRRVGYSPEEARAQILAEIPEMKEENISEESLKSICAGAHGLLR